MAPGSPRSNFKNHLGQRRSHRAKNRQRTRHLRHHRQPRTSHQSPRRRKQIRRCRPRWRSQPPQAPGHFDHHQRPQHRDPRDDLFRPGGKHDHHPARLRPRHRQGRPTRPQPQQHLACRPRRHQPRRERLPAARRIYELLRHRRQHRHHRQTLPDRRHARAQRDVRTRPRPRGFHDRFARRQRRFQATTRQCQKAGQRLARPAKCLSLQAGRPQRRGTDQRPAPPVGHVDRPLFLHGLQRLPRRLPIGKQHPDRRQGSGRPRPRNALDPHGSLFRHAKRQ